MVRVEWATVEADGQAIVGAVSQGEGMGDKVPSNPMHQPLPMHQSLRCGAYGGR